MKLLWIESIIDTLDGLTLRLRLLTVMVVTLLVGFLWIQFGMSFLQNAKDILKNTAVEKMTEQSALESQVEALTPEAVRQKIEVVKKEGVEKLKTLQALDEKVHAFSSKIVEQKSLNEKVLQSLLSGGALRVIHWENEGSHALFDAKGALLATGLPVETPLNKNSNLDQDIITLKFEGGYFSFLHYLKQIEKLGWQLFFNSVDYEVTVYPMAAITLQIGIPNVNEN